VLILPQLLSQAYPWEELLEQERKMSRVSVSPVAARFLELASTSRCNSLDLAFTQSGLEAHFEKLLSKYDATQLGFSSLGDPLVRAELASFGANRHLLSTDMLETGGFTLGRVHGQPADRFSGELGPHIGYYFHKYSVLQQHGTLRFISQGHPQEQGVSSSHDSQKTDHNGNWVSPTAMFFQLFGAMVRVLDNTPTGVRRGKVDHGPWIKL
jgi:hypothetical protein